MALESLDDLFLHHLKDTYDAEKRILRALPKMAKATSSEELRAAFEEHKVVTQKQVERLEKVFKAIKKPVRGKKCAAMEGLLEEANELFEEDAEPAVLDAALIAAAQKVEHYEIAAYGTMSTYANILGLSQVVKLLEQTLAEEKETDQNLTQIASTINFEADNEEEDEE